MRFTRFKFGVLVSLLWIGVMAIVVFSDPAITHAMKPNEWGDFFAGFFAPLAFLWLILGYMQQGDELQLSTKALRLQAEELKNSVQQQRELVAVTRLQLQSEREALDLERLARQEAAKPLFVVKNTGGSFSGTTSTYNITIANAGNTVTQVVGFLEGPDLPTFKLIDITMFTRSSEGPGLITLSAPFPESGTVLTITYIDAYGQPGRARYSVRKQNATPNSMLAFSLVED